MSEFETQFHFAPAESGAARFAFAEAAMGTVFVFQGGTTLTEEQTQQACLAAMRHIHEADQTFSLYKPESPLSRLARGEISVAQCPEVVSKIWDECEDWERTTDGWFSAFTPQHTFDPSGLVKTWAAHSAADALLAAGITDFSMNAGGDIWVADGASRPSDWRVAISKPVSIAGADSGVLTAVDLAGTEYRAVCTSGSAERGQHIWDPKAPERASATELVQVSVIAKDLVTADVWATAAFAHGSRCIKQAEDHNAANPENKIQVMAVFPDGNIWATSGFETLVAR